MQVNPEDRPTYDEPSRLKSLALLLLAIALAALVVWRVLLPDDKPLTLAKKWLEQPAEPSQVAPHLKQGSPAETASKGQPATIKQPGIKLPSLDDSDAAVRTQIQQLSKDTQLLSWFRAEHLIRRGVAVVNGLKDGVLLTKLLRIPPPKGPFQATVRDGSLWLDQANYRRYDHLVAVVSGLDHRAAANFYHNFRPLLREAYAELGYPESLLDETVADAIDQITAAPVIRQPIELKQESVAYTFANPELEKLPPIQKLLLRMGPENTRTIQQKAALLRDELFGDGSAAAQ